MNEAMAMEYAGRIVNSTTGWTPEATVELTRELMQWHNLICAEAAVDAVCHGWVERSRPPLGWIVRAYNVEMDDMRRRSQVERPRDDEPPCDFARGLQTAQREYVAEVRRNNMRAPGHPERVVRDPDPDETFLDKVIGRALGRQPS
jgi:hypothetical protein